MLEKISMKAMCANLAILIEAGLDGAIMDPTDSGMMSAVYTSQTLLGCDSYCMQYIKQQKRRRGK